jgi:hypothetical protein
MIIVHAKGQTCNKFFIYFSYLGDSLESGERIIVLAPDITIRDYPNLINSEIIKFPFYFEKFTKVVEYNFYIKLLQYFWENKYMRKFLSIFFKLIPGIDFVIASSGSHKGQNRLKYEKEIRNLFRPNAVVISEVNKAFDKIRTKSEIICGVHIRKGDYKFWNEGKYYSSLETYHAIMLNIKKIFANHSITFFISSNEIIDLSVFSNCNCFSIPDSTSTKDLYGLSISNYIVGPPSTFSGWASFYGNTPLYFIENPDEYIKLSSFKSIFEIWK